MDNINMAVYSYNSPSSRKMEDVYLFDRYVEYQTEEKLHRVLQLHNESPNFFGILRKRIRTKILTSFSSLELSMEAEFKNGSFVFQSYILDLLGIQNYDQWILNIKVPLHITQHTIGLNKFLVMGLKDFNPEGLTPNWGIWDDQACYFPRPCNLTFRYQNRNGSFKIETYNISTSNITAPGFIALPPFELDHENIRIIFYLRPHVPNSLHRIIIQYS